jgi:O-succinylbenzoic acid--CoA ligase
MSGAVAIIDDERVLTYAELNRIIAETTAWLSESGVARGDRIAFQLPNSWRTIALMWACFRRQAIACPISTRLPTLGVAAVVNSVGCRFMVRGSTAGAWTLEETGASNTPIRLDENLATIIFSSGTSKIPQAVAHTMRAHCRSAEGSNLNLPLVPGDRWLLSLPLYHVGGLGIVFRCVLAGATVVIDSQASHVNESVAAQRITHVSMVPTQLKRWLDDFQLDTPRWPVVLLGGDVLPPSLIGQACSLGLTVRTTYGLSEMASQVTATRANTPTNKQDTAGRVLPFREVAVSSGGEILVRGETLFRGYFGATGLTLPIDEEGWFPTRDLGSLSPDGYLTIIGRADNMLISGGENIHPEEIECLLLDHPSVRRVVVVSVPDRRYGERPVAFVDSVEFDEDSLRDWLRDRLPKFKIPDAFYPWPSDMRQLGIKPSRVAMKELASGKRNSAS